MFTPRWSRHLCRWFCLLALVFAQATSSGSNDYRTRRIGTPALTADEVEQKVGFWDYTYNTSNQLTSWVKKASATGALQRTVTLSYDGWGNRKQQHITNATGIVNSDSLRPGYTKYFWDAQDRLVKSTWGTTAASVSNTFTWEYDHRTRRIGLVTPAVSALAGSTDQPTATAGHVAFIFSGGLSVAEHQRATTATALNPTPTVTFVRGPDMGGGVGGLLYSQRGAPTVAPKYEISNGRGDIVAQSSAATAFTWTASYETGGKRAKTTGTNADRQRGNSKDEETRLGLLNEGFRYRDTETMVWLSRDPAGFVDGPNLYAYVKQNPWTAFDPDGLQTTFFLQPPTWLQPLVKTGMEGAKTLGESGAAVAPKPTPAPATNFRPSLDPTISPTPQITEPSPQPAPKSADPTTSQRRTQDNNHKILYIQNNFDEGSSQSNELHEFVGRWNGEIAKRGGSMTTRTPTDLEKLVKVNAQRAERNRNPAAYEGKVVGHVPDVIAGGSADAGPFMPLDARVNSSIGRQVQLYHNGSKSRTMGMGGFQYNEVRVIPKPPPPPPPPLNEREFRMKYA